MVPKYLTAWIVCFFVFCTSCTRQEQKPFVIAYPINWERMQDVSANMTGFTLDLFQEISTEAHIHLDFVAVNPEGYTTLLRTGAVDAVIMVTPEDVSTDKRFFYSNSYFIAGTVMTVSTVSPFRTLTDLQNKRIGYSVEDHIDITLAAPASWYLQRFMTTNQALEALYARQIDGVLLDMMTANRCITGNARSKLSMLMPPVISQHIRVASLPGKHQTIIKKINMGIQKTKKSGHYEELLHYWQLATPNR